MWAVFFDVDKERCSQAGETLELASTPFAYNLKRGVQYWYSGSDMRSTQYAPYDAQGLRSEDSGPRATSSTSHERRAVVIDVRKRDICCSATMHSGKANWDEDHRRGTSAGQLHIVETHDM